ncbi:hypothetical protein BKA61DRAFT_302044 [Leptodontidium sp. MPI-SDFR-AT-0119]|nr:hypothetical protein BKA61DRAFT_302044 [Leptodontidium sp. MPI-SDFR-AT-0119]
MSAFHPHPNPNPFGPEASDYVSVSPDSDARADRSAIAASPGYGRQKSRFRTMSFPRKRAVTACDTCRWKKTKCGNERPVCSSCAKHGWPCSYDPRLDHASFDPASLLILDKLHQTLQKLSEIEQEVKGQNRTGNATIVNDLRSPSTTTVQQVVGSSTTSPGYHHGSSHDSTHTNEHGAGACNRTPLTSSPSDSLEVPTAFGSTEAILTWPIFNGRWSSNVLSNEILIGNVPSAHAERESGKRASVGINEENVPFLVESFLQLVHSKNPVFHTQQIRVAARQVAECGFGWDASSCIVLLACALGAIARPYSPSPELDLLSGSGRTSLEDKPGHLETGNAFYQVARKRFGLLDQSIMAGQCHMLSGIFLMYTMRPLEAWSAFHQAGSIYSLYLKSQAALQERNNDMDIDVSLSQLEKRLEQRLYWTVLKSECEIRVQLDLPQSNLCKLDYPFLFPSPPSPGSPVESPESALTASSQQLQLAEEQTWFYYLSEIALRRIENRVLNAFYTEDHPRWLQTDLSVMIAAAEDIELQMETWYASLPTSIRFDTVEDETSDELRFVTRCRSLLIRGLIYRPFLYYAIHSVNSQTHWDLCNKLQAFVQKALEACLACETDIGMTHRHHGTWYALRESTTNSLLLLAARAAGLITFDFHVSSSPHPEVISDSHKYARVLRVCIEKLRYWEAEAPPDIALSRRIIEELTTMGDVDPNQAT